VVVQCSGGPRRRWRGGRGAAGQGEGDVVLREVDRFLEQRGGTAGRVTSLGVLRVKTDASIPCAMEQAEGVRSVPGQEMRNDTI
jgi:hypothetical protein